MSSSSPAASKAPKSPPGSSAPPKPGSSASPKRPASSTKPKVVDKKDVKPLSSGRDGIVYRARWKNLDVAVKVVRGGGRAAEDVVIREWWFTSRLQHPGIIKMHGGMTENDIITAAVLELMPGGDLATEIAKSKNKDLTKAGLGLSRTCDYGLQIAKAAQAIHDKGWAHLDLHPGNILLSGDKKTCKIADFGFAYDIKVEGPGDDLIDRRCGAIAWAAPEAIVLPYSYRADVDIWAMGVILWQMMTGLLPWGDGRADAGWSGLSKQELPGKVEDIQVKGTGSKNLQSLVKKCWSIEGSDRPKWDEIIKGLETYKD